MSVDSTNTFDAALKYSRANRQAQQMGMRPQLRDDLLGGRLLVRKAAVLGAERLVMGVNALDYSGYPACRPEFIAAFEYLATLATKAGVSGRPLRLWAPLQHLTKAGIIRLGLELGLDYALTHSCYDPTAEGRPCGRCDSCLLRARGFAEAGVPDPLVPDGL